MLWHTVSYPVYFSKIQHHKVAEGNPLPAGAMLFTGLPSCISSGDDVSFILNEESLVQLVSALEVNKFYALIVMFALKRTIFMFCRSAMAMQLWLCREMEARMVFYLIFFSQLLCENRCSTE